jgi:hypothetical protein
MSVVDHPRPIVCTCGHAFGHHDRTDPCLRCTRCDCGVYITDWDVARALGFQPAPHVRAPRTYRPRKAKGSARTRWMAYRREAPP